MNEDAFCACGDNLLLLVIPVDKVYCRYLWKSEHSDRYFVEMLIEEYELVVGRED